MTTVAAIDCGTNTIKLMIADLPQVHVREMRMVRLGQGVDHSGRLADEALARTFSAIDEYADLIRAHEVERIRFCATSASRAAANSDDFAAGVRERLGVDPEVLPGHEEARLAYAGAVRNLRVSPEQPVLVVDIGGGSTELIRAEDEHSMDIGSVRLHERHLHTDPPLPSEIRAAADDIDRALDASTVDLTGIATVVGVAGTITTLAAGVLDLAAYDRERIDQQRLPVPEVQALIERLLAMSVEERTALGYMHPGRADVIGAGALVLDRILRRSGVAELVVSESDILDGIAWSLT